MVLCLKARKSRSPPGLQKTEVPLYNIKLIALTQRPFGHALLRADQLVRRAVALAKGVAFGSVSYSSCKDRVRGKAKGRRPNGRKPRERRFPPAIEAKKIPTRGGAAQAAGLQPEAHR